MHRLWILRVRSKTTNCLRLNKMAHFRNFILPVLGLVIGAAGTMHGHEVRPAYLELAEQPNGLIDVTWKVPLFQGRPVQIEPQFPDNWQDVSGKTVSRLPVAIVQRWQVMPGQDALDGAKITVLGLPTKILDVLFRLETADGEASVVILRPESPSHVISLDSRSGSTWNYGILGIEHILLGIDHLLFVLGLLLIVKDRWMLLKTITSFTIAHSITLALATLGYASAPIEPLNAAIALSILFLGPEIVRSWRGESSFTLRHPWVVAFAFGLLHGFGFASGLSTTGLPPSEIPLALLLFNVGVEIGQIAFVGLVFAILSAFRRIEVNWPLWVRRIPGYAVGALGAFWTIDRVAFMMRM